MEGNRKHFPCLSILVLSSRIWISFTFNQIMAVSGVCFEKKEKKKEKRKAAPDNC